MKFEVTPPPQRRMHPLMKVLVLVGSAFALLFVVLVVGSSLVDRHLNQTRQYQTPQEVSDLKQQMLELPIPDRFQLRRASDHTLLKSVTRVMHWETERGEEISLLSLPQPYVASAVHDVHEEFARYLPTDNDHLHLPFGITTPVKESLVINGTKVDVSVEPIPEYAVGSELWLRITAIFPTVDRQTGLLRMRLRQSESFGRTETLQLLQPDYAPPKEEEKD